MKLGTALFTALSIATLSSAASAAVVDVVQGPTGFFVPDDSLKYSPPYYRERGEDWEWKHNAITQPFTTATLNISAFDVDAPGEADEIWAKDNGVWTLLGTLDGATDVWSYTDFVLGASLFDDIAAGLEVMMKIDTRAEGWLVSLAKSVITTDGALPPDPDPSPVPLPAGGLLLLSGLGGLHALRRRKRA